MQSPAQFLVIVNTSCDLARQATSGNSPAPPREFPVRRRGQGIHMSTRTRREQDEVTTTSLTPPSWFADQRLPVYAVPEMRASSSSGDMT
jgi:hypothetical protein